MVIELSSGAKTTGCMLVSKYAQQLDEYKTYLSVANGTTENCIMLSALKVTTPQKDNYFTPPVFGGSSYAYKTLGNIMANLLINNGDIDAAFCEDLSDCILRG